jgi:hypothetical protein
MMIDQSDLPKKMTMWRNTHLYNSLYEVLRVLFLEFTLQYVLNRLRDPLRRILEPFTILVLIVIDEILSS